MSTIPIEDLPRQQTLFNHLIDELERNAVIAPKVVKAREARLDSHRHTTDWLWSKVELAIQLDQQKRNRAEGSQQTPDDKIAGAPAPTPNPKAKATPKSSGGGNPQPKKTPKKEDVKAAPAPKAKPKAKPSGPKPPPPNRKGNTTQRTEEAKKVAKMSASEKAKTLLVAPSAATSGTMTVGILAAALKGALPLLPSALGGGPVYL